MRAWQMPSHHTPAVMLQADAGAQVVQIFDSWASELAPQDFDIFSAPYIHRITQQVQPLPGLCCAICGYSRLKVQKCTR